LALLPPGWIEPLWQWSGIAGFKFLS